MTTAILQEFRRKFTASALREEPEPARAEDHRLHWLKGVDPIEPGSQVLMFNSLPPSTLEKAAHLLRQKSVLLNLVTDHAEANSLIPDGTIAVAILPTLNGTEPANFPLILGEVTRVLESLGRISVTCLVSDEPLTIQDALLLDCRYLPTEQELLSQLERAGFYGIEVTQWDSSPRILRNNVEVRRVQVQAFKGKAGPCYECYHAVIYRGPWKSVHDDDGHVYHRGERTAVCEKTFRLLTHEPYRSDFIPVPPYVAVPVETAAPFDCHGDLVRPPSVTKGSEVPASSAAVSECAGDCTC